MTDYGVYLIMFVVLVAALAIFAGGGDNGWPRT